MRLKTLNEIAAGIINSIHDKMPDADTKEGTFIRDVFVDPIAYEIQSLYEEAQLIELAQSILTATEEDLDRLAMNFFVIRKGSTRSTGKLRFILEQKPTSPISIPIGSRAYTPATDTREELYFETTESHEILPNSPNTYAYDSTFKYYYVDIPAWSVETGEEFNIGTSEVSGLDEGVDEFIVGVTNPFGFSGGTDTEDDESLSFRVSLAITGSNIGTKDGYTSFVFKQDGVVDAKVIGAGEPLMTRDKGMGGMVDIYVRAENIEEYEDTMKIDYEYISDTSERPGYSDIKLQKQPIVNIVSIYGKRTEMKEDDEPISYVNGSGYEIEQGTERYFHDLEWEFVEAVENEGEKTLEDEAREILSTRLSSIDYLYDLKYNINYALIDVEADNVYPQDQYFNRGFYSDGLVYVLKSKDDSENPYVGGRIFVKKNGRIYERSYVIPDFILVKDATDYGNSMQGKDAIRWLPYDTGAKRPVENEEIVIKYNYNATIETLQSQIEEKRVLTADVLIKQARRVGAEIKIEAVLEQGYTEDDVRISIINQITNYINNLKQLGNSVDRSDIIAVVRMVTGVEAVNIDNVYLARTNESPSKQLSIKGFEYLEVDRIVVTIQPPGTVV